MADPFLTSILLFAKTGGVTAATRIAITSILPRLFDPLTKNIALREFRQLLEEGTGNVEQAVYLYHLFEQETILSKLSAINSLSEIKEIVSSQLIGHNKHEQTIVIRALLLSIGRSISKDSWHRVTMSQQIEFYLQSNLPNYREVMIAYRLREAAPAKAAVADLARILQEAGQMQARITVDASGQVQLHGDHSLVLTVEGNNQQKMSNWLAEGAQEVLQIDSSQGKFTLSLGSQQLDSLFLPNDAEAPTRLEFRPLPQQVILKLGLDTPEQPRRYVNMVAELDRANGTVVFFLEDDGGGTLSLRISLTHGKENNINFHAEKRDYPFPENMRSILQAIKALTVPGLNAVEIKTGNTIFNEASLWGKEASSFRNQIWMFAEIHLMHMDIHAYVVENGVDPETLVLPEMIDQETINSMVRIVAAIRNLPSKLDLKVTFNAEQIERIFDRSNEILLRFTNKLSIGTGYIETVGSVVDANFYPIETNGDIEKVFNLQGNLVNERIKYNHTGITED